MLIWIYKKKQFQKSEIRNVFKGETEKVAAMQNTNGIQ